MVRSWMRQLVRDGRCRVRSRHEVKYLRSSRFRALGPRGVDNCPTPWRRILEDEMRLKSTMGVLPLVFGRTHFRRLPCLVPRFAI